MPVRPLLAALLTALVLTAPVRAQDDDDPFKNMYGDEQPSAGTEDLPDEPLERARMLLARGRHDEAESLLRGLREQDPAAPGEGGAAALEPGVLLGRLLIKCGRHDEAQALLEQLFPGHGDRPELRVLRGQVLERRGDLKGAAEAYLNAWTLAKPTRGPVRMEALVRAGELLAETDRREEGGKLLEQALELYQAQEELTAPEFAWVARACRLLDTFPAIKKQYQRRMVDYSRRMLDQALLADGTCVAAHVEAGTLALLKYDTPGAVKAFQRACELDPNHPDARVGLARATLAAFYSGQGRYEAAADNLRAALAVDPGHPGAHATLAWMAVTDGEYAQAAERLENALRGAPQDVELRAVRAAVLLLRGQSEAFAAEEQAVLAERAKCARFYEQVANLITLKFRYVEARDLARKGLLVDPGYHPLLQILGVNLTRTGEEAEGRRILAQAWENDPFNVYTFNTLEMYDRLEGNYVTRETEHFVVRMHKDEVKGAEQYVLDLLEEARAELHGRYGSIPDKTYVELFPDHNDFSARSVGLPGMPILGVCFGNVVTVLSSKEKRLSHSWGRTLWHEFAHVATLTRTKNRTTRWLTEGLSVWEESQGRPSWTREYDGEIMTLMARGLLLPIASLDSGFTKPRYGNQVLMSYYQGGVTCEFIVARWGFPKILGLLDAYREGLDTGAAIQHVFGIAPEAFDAELRDWLERRYAGYAWLPPPSLEDRQALLDEVTRHPWSVGARGALARAYALHGQQADAEMHAGLTLRHAETAVVPWSLLGGLDPLSGLTRARAAAIKGGVGDAYLALAIVNSRRNKPALAGRQALLALEQGTRDPVTALQVRAGILRARGDLKGALHALEQARDLSPPNADLTKAVAALCGQTGDQARAMAELKRACSMDSEDVKTRLEVAKWAKAQGRWQDVAEVLDDVNLIDPFLPEAHMLLGEGLRRTAQPGDAARLERAAREYQAALDQNVDYKAGAHLGLALCHEALDRLPEALMKARMALADDADNKEAQALEQRLEAKGVQAAEPPPEPAPAEEAPAPEAPAPPPGGRR